MRFLSPWTTRRPPSSKLYSTHEFAPSVLDQLPEASAEFAGGFVRTRPISIRVPEPMLAQIKRLAAQKGVACQALIKLWLDERLQQERRADLAQRRCAGAGEHA